MGESQRTLPRSNVRSKHGKLMTTHGKCAKTEILESTWNDMALQPTARTLLDELADFTTSIARLNWY